MARVVEALSSALTRTVSHSDYAYEGDGFRVRVTVSDNLNTAPHEGGCTLQTVDSNGYSGTTLLRAFGDITSRIGVQRDDLDDTGRTVTATLTSCSLPDWDRQGIAYAISQNTASIVVPVRHLPPDSPPPPTITYTATLTTTQTTVDEGERVDVTLRFSPPSPRCPAPDGTWIYYCNGFRAVVDFTDSEADPTLEPDDAPCRWSVGLAYDQGCKTTRQWIRFGGRKSSVRVSFIVPNSERVSTRSRTITAKMMRYERMHVVRKTYDGAIFDAVYVIPGEEFALGDETVATVTVNDIP